MSSLESGHLNSSGTAAGSFSCRQGFKSPVFFFSFNSFNVNNICCALSTASRLTSSSSTITFNSFCSSFFNSVALTTTVAGSPSDTPLFAITSNRKTRLQVRDCPHHIICFGVVQLFSFVGFRKGK